MKQKQTKQQYIVTATNQVNKNGENYLWRASTPIYAFCKDMTSDCQCRIKLLKKCISFFMCFVVSCFDLFVVRNTHMRCDVWQDLVRLPFFGYAAVSCRSLSALNISFAESHNNLSLFIDFYLDQVDFERYLVEASVYWVCVSKVQG